ncbi:MAG: hypothetical protein AAB336_06785 [Acidobacteriota bacterium]
MNSNQFELKLLELHWLKNTNEQKDLCCHGTVFVRIGDEIICDKDKIIEVTVSSTALHLMRTLKENYQKGDYGNQLLPCCGHFIVADEEDFVIICGCPIGIDWTIIHTDDGKVKHISEKGSEAIIDKEIYKTLVFDFADQVESFYQNSLPKIIPEDDFEKNGYLAFWNEWRNLCQEFSN